MYRLIWAILCVFVILSFSTCVEPVGLGAFLEDEKVLDIIAGGGGGTGENRFYVVLQPVTGGPTPAPSVLDMNLGQTRNIALLNTTGISSIVWIINGTVEPYHNNTSIVVNPPSPPFDIMPSLGGHSLYNIRIEARSNTNIPYSADVAVRVFRP